MVIEAEPEDGQLHTLGLLERLRQKTSSIQNSYSDLYREVDGLLRELGNPNLHDIANMSYRVELWDQYALHIRWTVAAVGHIYLARATFDEAVRQWPNQRLTLRHGIRVIQDHDPGRDKKETKIQGR
jgi:hypothetical protein